MYRHVDLSIHSKDSKFKVRCYSAGVHEATLCYAVIADSEQLVIGTHVNMVKEGVIVALDGKPVKRCEFSYRRVPSRAPCKWLSSQIISK